MPIAGDASARRYLRLCHEDQSVILMDAPPTQTTQTAAFVRLAQFLKDQGLCPPEILATDQTNGLIVMRDLGPSDYAAWLKSYPTDESILYRSALDVLIKLDKIMPFTGLTLMTPQVGAEMVTISCTHYAKVPAADLQSEMYKALAELVPDPTTLALRDYHAENLIWRADREGLNRVGLLDFQDAFIAPAGYDLASLLRDARRDVAPGLASEMISYFVEKTRAPDSFRSQVACLGVQRNLRILGVFARLSKDIGKTRYLAFLGRVWDHIMQDLQDPALANLRQVVNDTLPPPTPALLDRLRP